MANPSILTSVGRYVLFATGCLHANLALAQQVSDPTKLATLALEALREAQTTGPDRAAFEKLKLSVTNDRLPVAASSSVTSDQQQVITVGREFLLLLDDAAWVIAVANITGYHDLAADWMRCVQLDREFLYPTCPTGRDLAASLPESLHPQVRDQAALFGTAAILFVVAHEAGHHILQLYPSSLFDSATQREAEARVDRWAARQVVKAGGAPLGLLPLMLVDEARLSTPDAGFRWITPASHPSAVDRLKASLCAKPPVEVLGPELMAMGGDTLSSFIEQMPKICESIKNISIPDKIVPNPKRASEWLFNGDLHAAFNRPADARLAWWEAARRGNIMGAWRYGRSVFEAPASEVSHRDRQRAALMIGLAAANQHRDATVLRGQISSDKAWQPAIRQIEELGAEMTEEMKENIGYARKDCIKHNIFPGTPTVQGYGELVCIAPIVWEYTWNKLKIDPDIGIDSL